jgi:hypothetical protein
VLRLAPAPPAVVQDAALADVASAWDTGLFTEARPMMVQSVLRHAMSEAISEGIINCLIVTSSAEANVQLTRIHEHLFARKCLTHPPLNCCTHFGPSSPPPFSCLFKILIKKFFSSLGLYL